MFKRSQLRINRLHRAQLCGAISVLAGLILFAKREAPVPNQPTESKQPQQHVAKTLICEDFVALLERSDFAQRLGWVAPANPRLFDIQSESNWVEWSEKPNPIGLLENGDSILKTDLNLGLTQGHLNFSRGFNFSEMTQVKEKATDLKSILPSNLSHSNDAGGIANQVINHSLSSFFNGEMMQSTSLGKVAKSVEETMKTDVAIGGSEPDSIQHKFQFQVNAPAAQAFLQYSGLTNAVLRYNVAAQSTELELSESLGKTTTMVYSHNASALERRDTLSIRLPW